MCARVCVYFCAHVSSMWNNIAGGRGVCVCGRWWDSQQWKREKNRRVFVCVCNLRAILFVKYENPLFFVCKCVSLCLCMFWVGVHSSGYLEIVCRFVFHPIVILVSFIFSPSFLSFLLFFIVIITFCIDFAQFPPKWCTRLVCSDGIWLSHFEISCIYFVCYGCCCRRRCYTQTIPGRLACLDGFLFLCQYEHNL